MQRAVFTYSKQQKQTFQYSENHYVTASMLQLFFNYKYFILITFETLQKPFSFPPCRQRRRAPARIALMAMQKPIYRLFKPFFCCNCLVTGQTAIKTVAPGRGDAVGTEEKPQSNPHTIKNTGISLTYVKAYKLQTATKLILITTIVKTLKAPVLPRLCRIKNERLFIYFCCPNRYT